MLRIKYQEFWEKYVDAPEYKSGIYIPESIFTRLLVVNPPEYITLPDNVIEIIENRRKDDCEKEAERQNVFFHQKAGIENEKAGEIEDAISHYKEAITISENSRFRDLIFSYYGYERLIACFHKLKRYDEEITFVERLLHNITATPELCDKRIMDKYQKRLNELTAKANAT